MRHIVCGAAGVVLLGVFLSSATAAGGGSSVSKLGEQLFERETFGNGRTCRTCHSADSGTVSPQDAAKRLKKDSADPLFIHDGSDDGVGHGVSRMLRDATVLITIPLPANVTL